MLIADKESVNMAEDLDVDALLEAPYRKSDRQDEGDVKARQNGTSDSKSSSNSKKHSSRSDDKDRKRARSGERKKRSRSRERKRSRSRDRKRSRSPRDKRRSRSPRDRRRSRSPRDKRRSRSPPRDKKRRSRSRDRRKPLGSKEGRRSRSRDRSDRKRDKKRSRSRDRKKSKSPKAKSPSPLRLNLNVPEDLTPEERDARTVFCMQLSARIRARDLEEFFSAVGKVKDVRLIMCNKTRRFKGIAYIEFKDVESVPLAMGLSGQKVLGIPIVVQHTQAEKNRAANPIIIPPQRAFPGPMRLYVGSLHFNITEDMLRAIFEPFGKIDNITLMMDPETGRSKGYGFISFHTSEDAKKALEQLNGFELAGRPMKVGHVTERTDITTGGPSFLDSDELDRAGIDLGATGRLQLMAKLAEGTGFEIPQAAANALSINSMGAIAPPTQTPSIATQCVMLSNMFDSTSESNPRWEIDIRDDVIEECNKHGGVMHVYVDKSSPSGNVYLKCPTISSAAATVNALHGRWFAGKIITAAYVPLLNYHSLFPDAMAANQLLLQSSHRIGGF